MEKIKLDQDIQVLCVSATSFPEGISAAFDRLHALLSASPDRKIYGLSRPENNGAIVYRAAAEVLEKGEAEKLGADSRTIEKGNYLSMTVRGIRKDPMAIGRAFEQLLDQPGLDPEGYCVEEYAANFDSVRCMIRLAE